LAAAGAFEALHPSREDVFESVEILLRYSAAHAEEKESRQERLYGGEKDALPAHALLKAEKLQPLEKLRHEFEAVGFYLSAHPLDGMAAQLERLKVVPSNRVEEALMSAPTNRLRMAGIVVRKQERTSQK